MSRPAPVVSDPRPSAPEAVREAVPAPPGTGAAVSAGSILSAPVMEDAALAKPAEDVPVVREAPRPEPPRPERAVTAADTADSYRPAHAESQGKTFDVAATRRRPVVFEEDDDLDVPDFLK